MAAMSNLANTMEANDAATMQAVERMGQLAGNGNGNGNGNGERDSNNLGGAPMTLASFVKVHPPTFKGSTNPTKADNWFQAMERALQAQHVSNIQFVEFVVYQLLEEAQHWWQGECRLLQLQNADIPWDIWVFSELVNKARVVEDCEKKVALERDTQRGNNNRGHEKYLQPKGQSFKTGGHTPQHLQGRGNDRRNNYDQDCTSRRNPNAGRNQHQGRVFAVNACDTSQADRLMRDKCLFGDKTLVTLYDTGASHSFIAFDKVEELGLKMSKLAFDLHVHILYQAVVTRSGYRQISFKIEDRNFVHDLMCLPMVGLEKILGFD
ncbi:uncharacterized protein LOC107605074 [Arachis ipaensis]|uniref:uncharacterized protein LOC107605074 n=1 Tax=Arachis ipaensis TaxID=130454 RepID=UPI0007AF6016|nr:uncharacterized protein LOC107605074 [Arachis ipaensis]